jgi:hypothetical protein
MTAHLLIRSWRGARIATVALSLAAAALTVSGSATTTVAPQTAAAPASLTTGVPCLSKSSAERVRADSTLDGVDPNDLTPAQTQQAEAQLVARAQKKGLSAERAATLGKTKIDVYVHVIETDAGKGGVSTSKIKKQISVLNKAYAGKTSSKSNKTAFSFKLKHIDKTKNSDWYSWADPDVDSSDDVQAKTALHKGGFDDLNVYVTSLADGLLGYATFPQYTTLARDGVVILRTTLPGGSEDGYNKGDTATHEVGHWLGLLHTFENGCTSPGDEVADTPYQADGTNVYSCDSSLDTCAASGKDPVHNFMSYGDDKCLSRFTKGQAARMATTWLAYRAPSAT